MLDYFIDSNVNIIIGCSEPEMNELSPEGSVFH